MTLADYQDMLARMLADEPRLDEELAALRWRPDPEHRRHLLLLVTVLFGRWLVAHDRRPAWQQMADVGVISLACHCAVEFAAAGLHRLNTTIAGEG